MVKAKPNIARAAAGDVGYVACVRMLARLHPVFQTGAIWFCSNEAYEELMLMQDGSGRYIWNVNSTAGADRAVPGFLLGHPLFPCDSCSALGDRGELVLVAPSAVGFGLRENVALESNGAPGWYKNLMAFRAIMRATAAPLLSKPITPRNGASTLSFATVLE